MQSNYSLGEKVLHYFALGSPLMRGASYGIEGMFPRSRSSYHNDNHVYISGLARSGTTILMRRFYETNCFRSLTYRDMPFVLMPKIWRKVIGPFREQRTFHERAHGDGIEVSVDSPEAFEEVFWIHFAKAQYIFPNCLKPHVVDHELIEEYRRYVRRVLGSTQNAGQTRYLGKNNNNILRLGSIKKAFPKSLIIIPFREPVQQSISLMRQHARFGRDQLRGRFVADYMSWLGHHEFGVTHKPFVFSDDLEFESPKYDTSNINYWIDLWVNTYSYLLDTVPNDVVFVCYEKLCSSPNKIIESLFDLADVPFRANKEETRLKMPRIRMVNNVDDILLRRGIEVYQMLRQKSTNEVASPHT